MLGRKEVGIFAVAYLRMGVTRSYGKGIGYAFVSGCFFVFSFKLIIRRHCVSALKQVVLADVLINNELSVRACFGFWMMFRYCSGAFRGVRVCLGRVAVGWILGG